MRRKNEPASRSSTKHPRSDFASHVSRRSALIVSWKRSPVRSGAKIVPSSMRGADVTVNGYELPVSAQDCDARLPTTRCPAATSAAFHRARAHFVLGTPLEPPFPEGVETAMFGMGCFWGAERKFWQTPGVYTTAVGYAGGFTPNPTYEEVCSGAHRPQRGRAGGLRPGARSPTTSCCACSGRATTRPRACARATTSGTQYRSGIYVTSDAQRQAAEASRDDVPGAADRAATATITTEIVRRARVLLRRGLPPAVPREEPERLLRDRRHRGQLPNRSAISLRRSSASGGHSPVSGGHRPTRRAPRPARGRSRSARWRGRRACGGRSAG